MSENLAVLRDTFWLLCGKSLGRGMTRTVYECSLNKEWVVKVEDASQRFQNVVEWETWRALSSTKYAVHFAPCHHISSCGSVLIMSKTHLPRPNQYPNRMPIFLTDFKRPNYGMIGRRIVCHDYGTNVLIHYGTSDRYRRVEWWDE